MTDETEVADVSIPESIAATANSTLNDIVQATGGTGRVSFNAKDANGLSVKDNGDSTFTVTGKAPANEGMASIDVTYADEGSQKGKVTVTVTGVLSPHEHVRREQVAANA